MPATTSTGLRHLPGALVLFAASTLISQAQEHDRSKVPDEYKWDLTAIYPSDRAWRAAKEKLASEAFERPEPASLAEQGILTSAACQTLSGTPQFSDGGVLSRRIVTFFAVSILPALSVAKKFKVVTPSFEIPIEAELPLTVVLAMACTPVAL